MFLRPYGRVERIEEVDLAMLWSKGFRGLILDLDNTLLAYGVDEMPHLRSTWVQEAQARGFRLVILSNNFPPRVEELGRRLRIPALGNALKPLPFVFMHALHILQTPRSQCLMIGDQLLTDHLGAALFGIRGILTEPLVPRDFPLTRILRFLERALLQRQAITAQLKTDGVKEQAHHTHD